MAARRAAVLVALLACLAAPAAAYYLPGTYPKEFFVGDVLPGECAAQGRPGGCDGGGAAEQPPGDVGST